METMVQKANHAARRAPKSPTGWRQTRRSLSFPDDALVWRCVTRLEKRLGDVTGDMIDAGTAPAPFEVIENVGNLLVIGGGSAMWQTLIGNGTSTAGQALTYFNNANASIGVGDSTTAAANTQTDLQAATNKLRKAMDASYPTHTDSTGTVGSLTITFRVTFSTAEANYAWQEWAVFNSPTAGVGRMLNRKVESLGTKTSAASWTFTVTISLA